MKFAVTLVTFPGYPHSRALYEVAETLHYGLLALGHDSLLATTWQSADWKHIVLGAHLLPQKREIPPPGSIVYNLEQVAPESPWMTAAVVDLLQRFDVWDYSRRNIAKLAELGVENAAHLPIGYVPELTRIEPSNAQDIDVLFYGSVNPRRQQVLQSLQSRGLVTKALFGVYGAQRDRWIARAKIVLNVHFYTTKILEVVRISYLLANRRCVVSETGTCEDDEAFADGLLFADYDDLVETVQFAVERPDVRETIAQRGFELISSRLISENLRVRVAELSSE